MSPLNKGRRTRFFWLSFAGFLSISITLAFLFRDDVAHEVSRARLSGIPWPLDVFSPVPVVDPGDVTMVVASQTADNTTWLRQHFPEWQHVIYSTDDLEADFYVPANKGREAMVYLTFIIDNYHKLPNIMIFTHAQRYQWHNDDPLYDGRRMLARLQIPYVAQQGYVNLRCSWLLGCPDQIQPLNDAMNEELISPAWYQFGAKRYYFKPSFEAMFPGVSVPKTVGVGCCAQFAVTANQVRKRPRSEYQRYRRWVIGTELEDDTSGRIMEFMWHIIFGQPAVHCPRAADCYCKTYGLCKLNCESKGVCESQWPLPPNATLPMGWPEMGWEGRPQDAAKLQALQEFDQSGPEELG